MARRLRAAAQAAAASLRAPVPDLPETSDGETADAPETGPSTPQEEEEEEEEPASPAVNSEPQSEAETPVPAPSTYPRKRRLGRPPKNKPPDWDAPDEPANDAASDIGTPVKRKRGRPPASGGRWKGKPSVIQVPIDKEGNMMDVINDEVQLPDDPEGEMKVDKLGNLLGGREYRCRTFTILDRGERLYMLSTEPARCIGFRDSYLFFQKHKLLYKIIIDDSEKRDLIERDLIPHSYKGRAIGVVTARSVFREFGARIIVGGRRVIDDYQAQAARENGDVEGELADPNDKLPPPGEPYNQNQYVAWHGASSVYHTGAPSVPTPAGKLIEGKKRKVVVTGSNWMFEHAREASRYNSAILAARREALDGTYDPHTNLMHFPAITQPTHARWEEINTTPSQSSLNKTSHPKLNGLTNGDTDVHMNGVDSDEEDVKTIFPEPPLAYTRNLLVVDTHFVSPPVSGLGNPGPGGEDLDLSAGTLADVPDDVLAELSPECRDAFEKAREEELRWKNSFSTESDETLRGRLRIGYGMSLAGPA